MKKLILASCLLIACSGFAVAQTSPASGTGTTAKTSTHQSHKKTSVKTEKSPSGIKKDSTSTTMHKKKANGKKS